MSSETEKPSNSSHGHHRRRRHRSRHGNSTAITMSNSFRYGFSNMPEWMMKDCDSNKALRCSTHTFRGNSNNTVKTDYLVITEGSSSTGYTQIAEKGDYIIRESTGLYTVYAPDQYMRRISIMKTNDKS